MMDSRRPSNYGHPPPPPHDPRQQHPPQQQQQQQPHHPQHHYQHPQPPPPPPPPQYSSPHPPPAPPPSQQQAPPQHHHQTHPPPPHSAPSHPGPPPPRAPPQQQPQQYQSRPPPPQAQSQQYPSSAGGGPPSQSPALPPIQSAAYPPPATSTSEQQVLPPFRHPSAPPTHDPGPEYRHQHPQYNHVSSGHQTPASVNRTYSHDSGHQRSPTTPGGAPPPSHYPLGPDGQQPGPPPQQMEHGGHHGYPPNGVVPHGMPQHHPEQHHPQYMPPMMDQHHGYGPPGPPMYGAPNYGPTSSNAYGPKRKQMRATQACEQCRQRKQKCDEGLPCSFCKENSLPCQYRDTPPVKTDKNMEKLLAHMEAHTASLAELTSKIDSVDARLRRVEQNGPQSGQPKQESHTSRPLQQQHETYDDTRNENVVTSPDRSLKRKAGWDDHRTAPHKLLLLWPSVKPLLKNAGVEHNDGYVMGAEDRGILRLWTRGEGIDEHDGTAHGGIPASPARSEDSSDYGATPQPEGVWGTGFSSTPNGDNRRSETTGAGGLKSNGELDLDTATINALYQSYMTNMHIMHPFLDKRRLRKMFDKFIRRYSTERPQRAGFAVPPHTSFDSDNNRAIKRQRSNDGSANNTVNSAAVEVRRELIERSPGNAIILLVLALGKICSWKEPLPAIVPDSKLRANAKVSHGMSESRNFAGSSPMSINMRPSSMSPNLTPKLHPTPPFDSRSRRSSVDGMSAVHAGRRNMDVIPGIAYYAKAAEILGEQGDGNDLVHAHMFLLAGLYKGQLARVKESMSWFSMAGRAIRTLLDRYKLWNASYWGVYDDVREAQAQDQSRVNKDARSSMIVIASWSVLQLETDILAEMQLPNSGIESIEGRLLNVGGKQEDQYGDLGEFDPTDTQQSHELMLMYYTAQVWLRQRLNKVHKEMYGPDCLDQPLSDVQDMFRLHQFQLDGWRQLLPPKLNWNDDDEAPSDILNARLRAKYWGARYVSNRPFLDYALHIMPGVEIGKPLEIMATDADGNRRPPADVHLFKAIQGMGRGFIWDAARRCIEAAMRSTVAFDNVPGRLIVTNIHGTAHAQFGNMLVLSATHESPYLKNLVPRDRFQNLMARTIKFLRRLAPISETCRLDCGILEKFNKTIFGIEDYEGMEEVYRNEGIESEEVQKTETVGSGNNSFSA